MYNFVFSSPISLFNYFLHFLSLSLSLKKTPTHKPSSSISMCLLGLVELHCSAMAAFLCGNQAALGHHGVPSSFAFVNQGSFWRFHK